MLRVHGRWLIHKKNASKDFDRRDKNNDNNNNNNDNNNNSSSSSSSSNGLLQRAIMALGLLAFHKKWLLYATVLTIDTKKR